jgi:hypothetical protein
MSHAINLCKDNDDDDDDDDDDDNREGSTTNAASVPSLPHTRKRHRDKEASSNDAHLRNGSGPGNTTATGTGEFVVDLELADEVEVSVPPKKKRRCARRSKRSEKNDAAGNCVESLKGVHAIENDVDSENVQVAEHQGIAAAAAASHHMSLDSEQNSQDNRSTGSTNKHFQKPSTSEPPSNASGRQSKVPPWASRLSELADYRKLHGHCKVPRSYKLGAWVHTQRNQYKMHLKGKASSMTLPRIQALEGIGFEWSFYAIASWEDRLTELVDYRKIQGHCNVPQHYNENTKFGKWVHTQRSQYKLHRQGKISFMTNFRIQALEEIGFEWSSFGATWEVRLSELAEYCRAHGHCNVPQNYSENIKLANWVGTQRNHYKLHLEGKKSQITPSRIQALESLSFDWKPSSGWGKGTPKKKDLDDNATCVRKKVVEAPEHVQTAAQTQDFSAREIGSNKVSVARVPEESDWSGEVHLGYIPGRTEEI